MWSSRPFPFLTAWLIAMSAVLVLTAAACGGDDDDAGTGVDASSADSEPDASEDEGDDSADDEGSGSGSGSAGATVTIDGVTYEATEEQSCTAIGGALGAAFTNTDSTLTITVALLPEGDTERSSVRVDDESDEDDTVQWESGGETVQSNPGYNAVANVREHTVDGRSGRGTAVFIDTTKMMTGTAEPTDGTFEVQCADV